jgi:hypothetical protein
MHRFLMGEPHLAVTIAGRSIRDSRHDSGAIRAAVVVHEAHDQTPALIR